jgi:hypothetical protein
MTLLKLEPFAGHGQIRRCEVWHNGELIAHISPSERGVEIHSERIENRSDLVVVDPGETSFGKTRPGYVSTPRLIVNVLP